MKGQIAHGEKVGPNRVYGHPYRPVPIGQLALHETQWWWEGPASIGGLVATIRKEGVKERITVLRRGRRKYCIIDGKKRWMAARISELTRVPVTIVKSAEDADTVWLAEYCSQALPPPAVDAALTLYEFAQRNARFRKKEIAALVGWRPAHVSMLMKAGRFLRRALLTKLLSYSQVAGMGLPLKFLYAVARLAEVKDEAAAVSLLLKPSLQGLKCADVYEEVCEELYRQKVEREY